MSLWDVATATRKMRLQHPNFVKSVVFSPDGTTFASGSAEQRVRLWDVATVKRKTTLQHTGAVNSVVFSPDGTTLATASEDGTILRWAFASMWNVRITPAVSESPAIGEQLTVQVGITAGSNIGGYQATVTFDPTALRYLESANGDYLSTAAFFFPPVASENSVELTGTAFAGVPQKAEGTLATLTFEVLAVKESILTFSDVTITDSAGEHLQLFTVSGHVVEPTTSTAAAIVRVTPAAVKSPEVGEELVLTAEIVGGENIADYEINWHYDETVLEFVLGDSGDYVPADGVGRGDGIIATATFRVIDLKTSTVRVSGYLTAPNGLRFIPTFESAEVVAPSFGDVNRDGIVDVKDLQLVIASLNQPIPEGGNPADVNGDGQVDIADLMQVAGLLEGEAAAPAVDNAVFNGKRQRLETLRAADVERWLAHAQQANLTDPISQRGILFLQRFLATRTPTETALLPNYPNPFNPETWIPYQLAEAADVTLTIFDIQGRLVRTLDLGHQRAGVYQSRSRAAYWDSRNAQGEPVASGVYFYTFTASGFTTIRKMLIRK